MRISPVSIALVATIIVSNVIASSSLAIASSGLVTNSLAQWFDYVVVIMMENHSINNTYGTSVPPNSWNSKSQTCLGNCTYLNSFANSNGLAEEYTADSIQSPSVGEYIAITSGYGNTAQGCNSSPPGTRGCPLLRISNIVDRLESAGLSWKAYMENYPIMSGCYNNFNGHYGPDHNPFIFYADIQKNATRCAHIVNANSVLVSQSSCWPTALPEADVLINDLNSASTAPNYMFLTPNSVDDNHDCNDISVGNAWLNEMIPQILGSNVFKTKRAALFLTFDEPGCTNSGCPSTGPQLYAVWASNAAYATTKAGFKSVNSFTHYSALRTIEDNWRLSPLIASTDGSAKDMQEFFR